MILCQKLTFAVAAENIFLEGFGPTYILQIKNKKDIHLLQKLLKSKTFQSTEILEKATDNEKMIPTPRWKISCQKDSCEILIKK